MKQDVQLSVLPSVQAFLFDNNVSVDDTVISGYCTDFRDIITKLVMLHNIVDKEEEGKIILDEVLSFCAYLYKDLNTMRQEMVEYIQ